MLALLRNPRLIVQLVMAYTTHRAARTSVVAETTSDLLEASGTTVEEAALEARTRTKEEASGSAVAVGAEAILSEPVRNDTVRPVEPRAMISITKFVLTIIID